MREIIDRIHDIPILEIIQKYAKLTKAGINYKGKCPFPGHQEKTASFIVSPNKNICKCFGCGHGGDAITFIQLVKGYAKPFDAIKDIAQDYNIPMPEKKEISEEEEKQYRLAEQLKIVYEAATDFYKNQLWNPENAVALEYLRSRTTDDIIEKFEIGIAPNAWTELWDYLRSKGFKQELLMESGLVREKNGKVYDAFRERIMFPLRDRSGRTVAFSGRIIPGPPSDQAKYINSPESVIFSKSKVFFGLAQARAAIAKKQGAYLVEGPFDVTTLFGIGVENTLASCGTAFTKDHIHELKRFTSNVIILFDGDNAGVKGIDKAGTMLIEEGMNCNVLSLPEDKDPDLMFKTIEEFKEYKKDRVRDFILWKTARMEGGINNFPDRKSNAITEISKLIVKYESESRREMYIEECAKIIPQRKLWAKEISTITKEKEKKEHVFYIPEEVKMADVSRWGFYVDENCYWFTKKDGVVRGSNFIMKPLFHIQSTFNAKRLYEITNEKWHSEVIELLQKDLISLQAFKLRVESLGNFIWEAGDAELNKLKRYLYEKTDTCVEIVQLGWQKHGFFAWANGIYNGKFTGIDKHGIVDYHGKKYYLPALSDIYDKDDTLFMNERRFIHQQKSNISFYDYCSKLISVFGPNAKIAISYYLATLYRDVIVRKFNFFPILNLFGPKGAGKTELAVSIMAFFGRQAKGPNINNTSKAALADHVAQVSNACIHIDEYKNSIDFEKIEFLKGLWDGTGRTRMNMDKDKKKETTAVDCGVILSGQEMPTADIALFSRLIYLTFNKVEYAEAEKKTFQELKDIEKKTLTHLTNENLSYRDLFIEKYNDSYDNTCLKLNECLNGEIIEDRLFKNWTTVIAAFVCLSEKLSVPFTVDELIVQAAKQLSIQQRETRTGNEVTAFWNIVQYLYADGQIQEDCDFSIKPLMKLKTQSGNYEWVNPKRIVFIQHSRILPLYQKYGKSTGEKVLPKESIDFYIRNDKRFLGKKMSHSFRNINPKTGLVDDNKPWKITTAYAFDYDLLHEKIGITLHADNYSNDETDFTLNENDQTEEEINELPF